MLPDLAVSCIECGNVTIANHSLRVPCAERHICRGDYCVVKRGLDPHTYCGSFWEGTNEERCSKQPGEAEQCVCKNDMCNVMLSPEAMQEMLRPTTTLAPTTTTYITTLLTTSEALVLPLTTTTSECLVRF
ncbi:unnamed protein product [Cylicostephanus goldi]|uniref:DUF7741 domain-containing protein n=1 Tax=Cylicostephanus goldi TaxID=71465 RepID=A0A3P6UC59_CYLGO|nr:unnamed protein product [Cylicostephanus goldi]